jgi:signal transduction histidine kinase
VAGGRDAASRAGVALTAELRATPTVGDPTLLERLAANLVDNAVRYNAPDGWVRVAVESRADHAVLVVDNSGPVVPPGEVDGLLEPFRRLNRDGADTRTGGGTGLGLSIVRSIATAHGGRLLPSARPDGGLSITVELPTA